MKQATGDKDKWGFHVVCGTPRSGSTLLCNLLAQNTKLHVSPTSPTSGALESLRLYLSQSAEVIGMLADNRDDTEKRLENSFRGFIKGWYPESKQIIDKSRGWSIHHQLLRQVVPTSAIICIVRNPIHILASIEKRNAQFAILDQSLTPIRKTLLQRSSEFLSPDGMVGSAILGVEDLLRRKPDRTVIIRYEDFVQNPEKTLDQIYEVLPIDRFNHDVNSVESVSKDFDAIHRNKYPHVAQGKIEPKPSDWRKWISLDVAKLITERWPYFCQKLDYM